MNELGSIGGYLRGIEKVRQVIEKSEFGKPGCVSLDRLETATTETFRNVLFKKGTTSLLDIYNSAPQINKIWRLMEGDSD